MLFAIDRFDQKWVLEFIRYCYTFNSVQHTTRTYYGFDTVCNNIYNALRWIVQTLRFIRMFKTIGNYIVICNIVQPIRI